MIPEWVSAPTQSNSNMFNRLCWQPRYSDKGDFYLPLISALGDCKQFLKNDRTTTVAKVEHRAIPLVIKRYNAKSMWHRFTRALRVTRARRCWLMSHRLASIGVNVASPVFMFEKRFMFLNRDSYYACEYLQGDELLDALPNMLPTQRQVVIGLIQELFEKFKQHKISHGDMKASNLIWDGQRIWLIDLDACKEHSSSLTWLKANKKDKRRFLKNWQDSPELLEEFDFLDS